MPQTPVPPAAGGEALRSPASGSWGPRPQAPIGLRWREAPPPEPKISPPPLRSSGYAPGSSFGEDLFFGLHLNSGKKVFRFW